MLVHSILEEEGATSFAIANTQDGAITAAVSQRPDVITSDVKLVQGTGPLAVEAIRMELGPIPVIFITGTPAECQPCDPPGKVVSKPIKSSDLAKAFHDAISP